MSTLAIMLRGLSIGASLILLLQLSQRRHYYLGADRLILFLGLLSLGFLLEVLSAGYSLPLTAMAVESIYWPFLPVALWCYVCSLTHESLPSGFWRRYWSPLLVSLCLVPLLIQSESVQLWFVAIDKGIEQPIPVGHEITLLLAVAGVLFFCLSWLVLLGGFGWAIVRTLRRYDYYLKNNYANLEGVDRHRIRFLLCVSGVVITAELADQISMVVYRELLPDWLETLLRLGLLLSFGLVGSRERLEPTSILDGELSTTVNPVLGLQIADVSAFSRTPAYARSSLTEADCHRILAKLDAYMVDNFAWRNSDLNLSTLAAATGVRANYISQALNTEGGQNFFDYVNRLRIEEALRLLFNSDDTVLVISMQVGFNSKSTFNTAFRRYTNQTPSQYRRSQARKGELPQIDK